jgi:hypothetical protein
MDPHATQSRHWFAAVRRAIPMPKRRWADDGAVHIADAQLGGSLRLAARQSTNKQTCLRKFAGPEQSARAPACLSGKT